jgi:hypothetical protein
MPKDSLLCHLYLITVFISSILLSLGTPVDREDSDFNHGETKLHTFESYLYDFG